MSWVKLSCAESGWVALSCTELGWVALSHAELRWISLSCAELRWVALSCAESCWVMLSCAELCWVALSHAESSWVELSRSARDFHTKNQTAINCNLVHIFFSYYISIFLCCSLTGLLLFLVTVLQDEPSWAKMSQAEPSWAKLSQAVHLSWAESSWVDRLFNVSLCLNSLKQD